jgi:hypothetical protein
LVLDLKDINYQEHGGLYFSLLSLVTWDNRLGCLTCMP